jgi:hypothetical protein
MTVYLASTFTWSQFIKFYFCALCKGQSALAKSDIAAVLEMNDVEAATTVRKMRWSACDSSWIRGCMYAELQTEHTAE